jgi:hypothetical protein
MTKKLLRVLRTALLLVIGLLLASLGALFGSAADHRAGAAVLRQGLTPTPGPRLTSQAGSTDWIVLMGVVVVLIVILPIILRRRTWAR